MKKIFLLLPLIFVMGCKSKDEISFAKESIQEIRQTDVFRLRICQVQETLSENAGQNAIVQSDLPVVSYTECMDNNPRENLLVEEQFLVLRGISSQLEMGEALMIFPKQESRSTPEGYELGETREIRVGSWEFDTSVYDPASHINKVWLHFAHGKRFERIGAFYNRSSQTLFLHSISNPSIDKYALSIDDQQVVLHKIIKLQDTTGLAYKPVAMRGGAYFSLYGNKVNQFIVKEGSLYFALDGGQPVKFRGKVGSLAVFAKTKETFLENYKHMNQMRLNNVENREE